MIRLSKDLYENYQRIHPRFEKATRVSSINQQGIHPRFEKATRVSVNKEYNEKFVELNCLISLEKRYTPFMILGTTNNVTLNTQNRRVAITYDTYMQPAAGSCRYGNVIRQYNERFAKQSLDFLVRALHSNHRLHPSNWLSRYINFWRNVYVVQEHPAYWFKVYSVCIMNLTNVKRNGNDKDNNQQRKES